MDLKHVLSLHSVTTLLSEEGLEALGDRPDGLVVCLIIHKLIDHTLEHCQELVRMYRINFIKYKRSVNSLLIKVLTTKCILCLK